MRTYESSAKTMQEAIEAGLEALGVSISDVNVETLDEGSKGLFGLFGSRLARVRLTVKEEEADPLADLLKEEPAPARKPAAEKPAKKPAEKKDKPAEKKEKPAEKKEKPAEKKEKPAEKAEQPEKAEKTEKTEKAEKPEGEKTAKLAKPVERKAKPKQAKAPKEPKEPKEEKETEKKELPPKAPVQSLEKPVVTMLETIPEGSNAATAKDFLQELTHLMGVDVEIAVGQDADENLYVQMTGDTLGVLIGRRGETLDALQYLTSLKVNRGQEKYTRVTLDTENYRARREDTLIRLANRMANRAERTGRRVALEPMNPYERRIIHSALQANEAVDTHSEGDEPNRHVVITVRK